MGARQGERMKEGLSVGKLKHLEAFDMPEGLGLAVPEEDIGKIRYRAWMPYSFCAIALVPARKNDTAFFWRIFQIYLIVEVVVGKIGEYVFRKP